MIKDEHWMAYAIEQAEQAQLIDEVPVGAIIIDENDRIIGKGYNQTIRLNDSSAHAEIMAIRDAGAYINNYRLVRTRLFVTLEPCMMCVGALIHARVDQVIFGAYDHKTGMALTKDHCFNKSYHNHQVSIKSGILENECSQLLKNFFKRKRQQKKAK